MGNRLWRAILAGLLPTFGIFAAIAFILQVTNPNRAHAGAASETVVIHVDRNAPGPGHDGNSWPSAYRTLQAALDVAAPGDEIWVARGVYTPTKGITRTATFDLESGVALYGGFAGYGVSETLRSQRDWVANRTVLSGDLGGDDQTDPDGVLTDPLHTAGENAYHVVSSGAGVTATAVLDGFVVTGGRADALSGFHCQGGGMVNLGGAPTLANVTFSGNLAMIYGGGLFTAEGDPALVRVTFVANRAMDGGGVYNMHGNPLLVNATFNGNIADWGGGMYNFSQSSPTLVNATFSGNAAQSGGGIYNAYRSNPRLINVSFSGNHAEQIGGGIYNRTVSGSTLVNCVLWGNTNGGGSLQEGEIGIDQSAGTITITHSLIAGAVFPGVGNISADPCFTRLPNPGDGDWGTPSDNDYGDLSLSSASPAIDAGDNGALPADLFDLDGDLDTGEPIPLDLSGNVRCIDDPRAPGMGHGTAPYVDLGAFEADFNYVCLPLLLRTHAASGSITP